MMQCSLSPPRATSNSDKEKGRSLKSVHTPARYENVITHFDKSLIIDRDNQYNLHNEDPQHGQSFSHIPPPNTAFIGGKSSYVYYH